MTQENVMRNISIDKVTINVGCGTDAKRMERAQKLLEQITGVPPVKTKTEKRVSSWGLRPGLPIGLKITLRGSQAEDVLKRFLAAKERRLTPRMFDNEGNVSFGIKESVDIPGVQYDPQVGILGLQISVTLKRPGFRIKTRRQRPSAVPKNHRIAREEATDFMKNQFEVVVE